MATPAPFTFDELFAAHNWRPIAKCPGRYRLLSFDATLSPAAVVGCPVDAAEYKTPAARDTVLVVTLVDGGVISYRKPDGTYVHTLNTQTGFDRKLNQLGIG